MICLRLEDSNTRFFSMATKIRSAKNSTLRILNKEGNKKVIIAQMEANSMGYFRKLLDIPSNPSIALSQG